MPRIITGDIYSSETSKLIQFALLYVKKLELGAKYIKWITITTLSSFIIIKAVKFSLALHRVFFF